MSLKHEKVIPKKTRMCWEDDLQPILELCEVPVNLDSVELALLNEEDVPKKYGTL